MKIGLIRCFFLSRPKLGLEGWN